MTDRAVRRPAVFLDRDGVINDLWYDEDHGILDSPRTPGQFRLASGAAEGLWLLQSAGWPLVVVSNQPGIAKRTMTRRQLRAVTRHMNRALNRQGGVRLTAVYYCLHHPRSRHRRLGGECRCRKPAPGLLRSAADRLGLDLSRSWLLGDGITDMQAAAAAGCRAIWIGAWKCEHCQALAATGQPVPYRAADLLQAARQIITPLQTKPGPDANQRRGLCIH